MLPVAQAAMESDGPARHYEDRPRATLSTPAASAGSREANATKTPERAQRWTLGETLIGAPPASARLPRSLLVNA